MLKSLGAKNLSDCLEKSVFLPHKCLSKCTKASQKISEETGLQILRMKKKRPEKDSVNGLNTTAYRLQRRPLSLGFQDGL